MPIYGKNHWRSFSLGSNGRWPWNLVQCIQHWVLQHLQVCLNDAPGLTITYFTARSKLVPYAFVWEKVKTKDFSGTHHHHHIHFRALFSSTEGWAFWQVFLEGVLSTQNGSEGQQNPYLASFCHSQALHPMISLACQIFSVQPHSACVLLQSSLCCALHVQTISSYWCGAPHLSPGCQALWEGSCCL